MDPAKFFQTLKSQNLSKLELRSKVTRQALHNALKTKNMKLDNLSSVAKAMNFKVELVPLLSEDNVLASLAKRGAPLAHSADGNLPLEVALAESCKLARQDGLYESVVPYVLAKNADQFEANELVGLALQNGQAPVLGYFVELANMFRPHVNLRKMLKLLVPTKLETKELLVITTRINFPEVFEKNLVAQKWNWLVRGTVDDHFSRWVKWERSQSKN
jgi:hypothetical protein